MKKPFSIIIIFIALAILGVSLIVRLPLRLMPSNDLPSVSVSFTMKNASSRIVESEVTAKLEAALARINGVKSIISKSGNGHGFISIDFDKYADMNKIRFETSAVIRQIWNQLPEGVSYPTINSSKVNNDADGPIITYGVSSSLSSDEILKYADKKIRQQLGKIGGVKNVKFYGGTNKVLNLTYDKEKLENIGTSHNDIIEALSQQNNSLHSGLGIMGNGNRVPISIKSNKVSIYETTIKIDSENGDKFHNILKLPYIADINLTKQEPDNILRINGLNTIYCSIYARESANHIETANQIKDCMSRLDLPEDFTLHLLGDSTSFISSELNNIYFRTALTLLILMLFLAFVTRNARYIIIIIISLLLTLCISIVFYYICGIEIQIYSLAGIMISLNLITDNIIVMSDHYRRHRNITTFTAVLAATLTTIGALGIVFLMEDEIRLNLQDFVLVVITNLSVSLASSLWLVPALIKVIGLKSYIHSSSKKTLLRQVPIFKYYSRYIQWGINYRSLVLILSLLAFGLPTFMIPSRIAGWDYYNDTIGSKTFQTEIKPWIDNFLGGTWNLFYNSVFYESYLIREQKEPIIVINASLPQGATMSQMDQLIKKMENFLSQFNKIKQFRTDINSPLRATITVSFTEKIAKSGFPSQLKSELISKALSIGGGTWTVYGIENNIFNNSVEERAGTFQAKLFGYNYDELESIAGKMRTRLLGYKRVKDISINSDFSSVKNNNQEFQFIPDHFAMANMEISAMQLFTSLESLFGKNLQFNSTTGSTEIITFSSSQGKTYDLWAMMNVPVIIGNKSIKLSDIGTFETMSVPNDIVKENQQYQLCLQFDYIGSSRQGEKVLDSVIKEIRDEIPMGYSIYTREDLWKWKNISNSNYWLILIILTIIYFISAILFNSLRDPLIILITIPISFIGVFLIFHLTGTNFDRGGWASLVLLSGITVNASIYLINEFKRMVSLNIVKRRNLIKTYLEAFRMKIIPILLTVLSTVLGFIPFLIGSEGGEAFWYPLAIGTIGGLTASLFAIIFVLPIFIIPKAES